MSKGNINKPRSTRQLQVGEEIRHALSDIFLRGDFYGPDNKTLSVTVSEVRVSPDLRNATVFIMPLAGRNQELTMQMIEEMTPQLRMLVTQKLRLRYSPALAFRLDDTFARAERTETLLRSPEVAKDLGEN